MSNTEKVEVTINEEYINKYRSSMPKYIKQEPYVSNKGIYVPCEEYVPEGCASNYRCVMTKEMFVDAYNKYIKGRRMYKGGWKK